MTFLELLNTADEATFAATVNAEHKQNCAKQPHQISQYQEILRAKWAIWYSRHESIMGAEKRYSIPKDVFQMLIGDNTIAPQKRQKRIDKYETVKQWCLENHLVQVSVNQIAEIGGFSYPTALKFINDRPDLFYKVKRGIYEVRNPNKIKEEEKARLQQ